jgi:hypothetical protein
VLPGSHTAPDVAVARRILDVCAREVGTDVDVDEVLGHGDPADELLGLTGPSTGLLVLGASGHEPDSTDAVGRAVRRHARCPVAVVPPGASTRYASVAMPTAPVPHTGPPGPRDDRTLTVPR